MKPTIRKDGVMWLAKVRTKRGTTLELHYTSWQKAMRMVDECLTGCVAYAVDAAEWWVEIQ